MLPPIWLARKARHLASRGYFRLVACNYDRRILARPNRTPAGTFRSYDLLNRHRNDEMLAALAADCGPADVVYDVGAHVGMYALALARESDRQLVAFEPSPPIVERLRANVVCNDLADRIEIHAYGLGDESGDREFFCSTYPELSSFDRESATRWEADVADTVRVPVRRLDDVTPTLSPPDVIKLDVEGSGPAVLRGGLETLREHRPTVFVEPHEEGLPGDRPDEMQDLLTGVDYAIDEHDGYWRCLPRDKSREEASG